MFETLRTSPPRRQLLLIAIAAIVLCALLAAAYFLWFRTEYTLLYRELREADAATIVAELDRAGTPYRLADGGRTILVPESVADAARVRIAGQDLPLQGTVGFELFNGSSIGLTEFAQRINLQRALQGELARTIMRIEGVEAARVHLTMGEQSVFRGDRRPPRASVAVTMRAGRRLNPTTVRGIQRLVAGSVPELDLASVTVLNDRGAVVSGEASPDMATTGTAEERNIQRFYESRIRRALEARYPPDAIEISVWADLGERTEPVARGGADRDFRLRVTVALTSPLNETARQQVNRAIEDAVGFDAGLGDSVTVTTSPPIATPQEQWDSPGPESESPANAASVPERRAEPGLMSGLWTPLALLALFATMLVLLRRRQRPAGPMSEPERLAFTGNLKALLAQRSADGA